MRVTVELKKKQSPELVQAAKDGNLGKVKQCIQDGADPNTLGKFNRDALGWAVDGGHLEVVQYLVGLQDINLNIADGEGIHQGTIRTPIMTAIALAHKSGSPRRVEIAKLLIADSRAEGNVYDTRDDLKNVGFATNGLHMLGILIRSKSNEVLKAYLERYPESAKLTSIHRDKKIMAMQYAVECNNEVAKKLLAEVLARDEVKQDVPAPQMAASSSQWFMMNTNANVVSPQFTPIPTNVLSPQFTPVPAIVNMVYNNVSNVGFAVSSSAPQVAHVAAASQSVSSQVDPALVSGAFSHLHARNYGELLKILQNNRGLLSVKRDVDGTQLSLVQRAGRMCDYRALAHMSLVDPAILDYFQDDQLIEKAKNHQKTIKVWDTNSAVSNFSSVIREIVEKNYGMLLRSLQHDNSYVYSSVFLSILNPNASSTNLGEYFAGQKDAVGLACVLKVAPEIYKSLNSAYGELIKEAVEIHQQL